MERIWVIPCILQDGWMDRKTDGWKDEHRKKQYKLFQALNSCQMFTGPLFQIKLHLLQVLSYSVVSTLLRSFEIQSVRQYVENTMGLVGILNTTVYKTEPIFGQGKLS